MSKQLYDENAGFILPWIAAILVFFAISFMELRTSIGWTPPQKITLSVNVYLFFRLRHMIREEGENKQ